MVRAAIVIAVLAGCGSFEDPDIVIDLRVLAAQATPAEQVVTLDPTQPLDPAALLAQLVPTEVCALVADPGQDRRLVWSMTACAFDDGDAGGGDRCDPDFASIDVGGGVIDDPDTTIPQPAPCATVTPDADLLFLLSQIVQDDDLRGLGGINYNVLLRIGGESGDRALDQYSAKSVRVSPRIPDARVANQNPTMDHLEAALEDGTPVTLPLGRCVETAAPYELAPATKLRLTPFEPDGAREVYVVPTLDGASQMFTESLTYQWVASAGSFSSGSTGGPRDPFGNPAPLFTDYKSPAPEDLSGPLDVSLWIVQRDERLGVQWYEACLRVVP